MPTVSYTVAASADDAHEKQDDTGFASTTGRLKVDATNSAATRYVAGIRYTGVQIPQGARINSAILEYQIDTDKSDEFDVTIYCHDTDNSANFTTTADVNSRALSPAGAIYQATGVPLNTYNSMGDIKDAVTKVTERAGWVKGNALTVIVKGNNVTPSRIGEMRARDLSSSSATTPRLTISFSQLEAVNGLVSRSTVAGELTVRRKVAGGALPKSTVAGNLTRKDFVAGVAAGKSTVAGNLRVTRRLNRIPTETSTRITGGANDPAANPAGLKQIQLVYALPSDHATWNRDRGYDTDGTIRAVVHQHMQWLRRVAPGRFLRYNVDGNGQPTVLHVVLPSTAAFYRDLSTSGNPSGTFSGIRSALIAAGLDDPLKNYLVWYEGGVNDVNDPGNAGFEFTEYRGDLATSVSQTGRFGIGMFAWFNTPVDGNLRTKTTMDFRTSFAMIHEVIHNLGAVQLAAPNDSGLGHVVDSNHDIMAEDWLSGAPHDETTWELDFGNNDYYHHSGAWIDVEDSTFFNDLPVRGSSTVAGNLTVRRKMAGTVAGKSTVAAAAVPNGIRKRHMLAGAITGISFVGGVINRPPALQRQDYTQAELIAELKSQGRIYKFRYDLLDRENNVKQVLDGIVLGCKIFYGGFDDIKRKAQMRLRDTGSEIDWLSDRIRPVFELLMPDGFYHDFPLGVFILESPTRANSGSQTIVRNVDAYDKLIIAKEDKLSKRYILPTGQKVLDIVIGFLVGIGEDPEFILYDDSEEVAAADREYDPGTPILTVVNDLLNAINFRSLSYNELGQPILRKYVSPTEQAATHTYYDDDDSVMFPSMEQTLDLFNVPNHWVLAVSQPDKPELLSVYTNENGNSPTSVPSRGRVITDFRSDTDATSQAILDEKVRRLAFEASQVYEHVDMETGVMPVHGDLDIIKLRYTRLGVEWSYQGVEWEFECRVGAKMHHHVRRLVEI